MIGETLGHYRITAKLGEGGMGAVYRAEDSKLGREVAIKVLPADLAGSQERLERFTREARAVAAMNHPNIVTLYAVEEHEGTHFIAMELVDGEALEHLIPEHGFSLDKFFELASPLADALSAAHEKGIVHRDLKPANVMVTHGGQVKVLDFGLAKLDDQEHNLELTSAPTQALTQEGVILGTVPYMSPEQVEGRRVDHRTDIFSLGIIFYEMLTGERPFSGESSAGLMSSILKDSPRPVTESRRGLPRHLGRVIGRCLEKSPVERYQTARDVHNELKVLVKESTTGIGSSSTGSGTGHSRPEVPWIAVLPIKHKGGDELEAFADGLGDDITTGLSRFSHLHVVARHSALRFKDAVSDVRQVGSELGARYILEGNVRKAGSALRVNFQVLDAQTGTHIWAETFDGNLDEAAIFDIQDAITDRLVSTVADTNGMLTHAMVAPVASKSVEDLTPYEALLRYFIYQQRIGRPEDYQVTLGALEHAVQLEPEFADAWAALSMVILDEHRFGLGEQREGAGDPVSRAVKAARRAVDIDPAGTMANSALAQAHFFAGDLPAFRSFAERAVAHNPRDGMTVAMMATLVACAGDWRRGVELATQAMELNPHFPGWYRLNLFYDAYRQGDYTEALAVIKQIDTPNTYTDLYLSAATHAQLGDAAAAVAKVRELRRVWPDVDSEVVDLLSKWFSHQPELLDHLVEGLRKAGLDVAGVGQEASPAPSAPASEPAAGTLATAVSGSRRAPVSDSSLVSPTNASNTPSIAVLPFTDMSPTRDQGWFCEGMAEELINGLSRIEGLRVAARTSAFQLKGKDLETIGEKLHVETVLDGSVRSAGDKLRVGVQLHNVADGFQRWSESYDRDMEDVFAIQDEIAASIVAALQVELGGDPVPELNRSTESLTAYKEYLQGRYLWLQRRPEDVDRAREHFEAALEADPSYALAYSGLADLYTVQVLYGLAPAKELTPLALEALDKALELEPDTSEVHSSTIFLHGFLEWDWAAGLAAAERAIELNPSNVLAHAWGGAASAVLGQRESTERLLGRAQELDPLSPYVSAVAAVSLMTLYEDQRAIEVSRETMELQPDYLLCLFAVGWASARLGRAEEAIAAAERGVELTGEGSFYLGSYGWLLGIAGRHEEAREILARLEERADTEHVRAMYRAWVHGSLGEIDRALDLMEQAFREMDPWLSMPELPPYDCVRAEPRFVELLRTHHYGRPEPPEMLKTSHARPERVVASAPVSVPEPIAPASVAVLPFTDMSPARDQDWFCEGMAEELINGLSGIGGLRVAARASAFQLKGKPLREIGEALRVATVLDGSVRSAGDKLRITVQLNNVSDGYQKWSARFDRSMDDVFAVQDEIASSIVEALEVELGGEVGPALNRNTENLEAYRQYLQGRHLWLQRKPDSIARAKTHFEAALEADPDYALAHTGLADLYSVQALYGLAPTSDVVPQADAASTRALELDPDLSEVQASLVFVGGFLRWDYEAAIRAGRRSIELNPGNVIAHLWTACLESMFRRPEAVDELLEGAQELDPLSPYVAALSGLAIMMGHRNQDAFTMCEKSLELNPDYPVCLFTLGWASSRVGQAEKGVAALARAVEITGRTPFYLGSYGWALGEAGRVEEARAVLAELEERSATEHVRALYRAIVHSALREVEPALELLKAAFDEADPWLSFPDLPLYDGVRTEPRFVEMLRQHHYPSPEPPDELDELSTMAGKQREEPTADLEAEPPLGSSIAVLPFTSLSSDSDDEFLADGIAEEILNTLGQVSDLKVAARTSAFSFKGKSEDLRSVGEQLGVSTVLEGSLQRAGERLRVTVQLVNAADGYQQWSERYDRTMADVFEVQDEIAHAIAERLQVTFAGTSRSRSVDQHSHNVEAYELYLQGRHLWYQRSPAALVKAAEFFERATELDPGYALAYAGIASSLAILRAGGWLVHTEAAEKAAAAARRAVGLAPDQAEAHVGMAYYEGYFGDTWAAAGPVWERALELDPKSSIAHSQYGMFLAGHGRAQEAHEHASQACELDPLAPFMPAAQGVCHYVLGEFEEAARSAAASLEIDPNSVVALWVGGLALPHLGRHEEAIAHLEQLVGMTQRAPLFLGMLGRASAMAGRKEAAAAVLGELEERSLDEYVAPAAPLMVALALEDLDRAEQLVRACIEDHTAPVTLQLGSSNALERLADEPRFADLIPLLRLP